MASIVKRKNKYSVVYTYQDEKGEKRQKWETFATNAEAKRRKAEVEFQQESGTLVIPEAKTVKELLEDYTSIYGVNTWAMSTQLECDSAAGAPPCRCYPESSPHRNCALDARIAPCPAV